MRAESLEVHPSPPTLMHKYPYFPHGIAINHTAVQVCIMLEGYGSLTVCYGCWGAATSVSSSHFVALRTVYRLLP